MALWFLAADRDSGGSPDHRPCEALWRRTSVARGGCVLHATGVQRALTAGARRCGAHHSASNASEVRVRPAFAKKFRRKSSTTSGRLTTCAQVAGRVSAACACALAAPRADAWHGLAAHGARQPGWRCSFCLRPGAVRARCRLVTAPRTHLARRCSAFAGPAAGTVALRALRLHASRASMRLGPRRGRGRALVVGWEHAARPCAPPLPWSCSANCVELHPDPR